MAALHVHVRTQPDQKDVCAKSRENDIIVRLLLERPDIDVNAPDKAGRTPLSKAIDLGHTIIADLLRQHPNINLANSAPISSCVGNESQKRECGDDQPVI